MGCSTPRVALVPSASAKTAQAEAQPCGKQQVSLSLGRGSVATGHHSQPIVVRNTTQHSCVLRGYPTLVAHAQGGGTLKVYPEPSGYSGGLCSGHAIANIVLPAGESASAMIEGTHSSPATSDATGCQMVSAYSVILPTESTAIALPLPDPGAECASLQVHPFVRGETGSEDCSAK